MRNTSPFLPTTAALVASATLAFSQGGPLTPPAGAPAPTMKTLDQIEPRTPLVAGAPGVTVASSGEITITQPGSYYLTGNIDINSNVSGIQINAGGVTVDLMGHSIRYTSVGNASYAIVILSSNVTIQNGHILSPTSHDDSTFTTRGFDWGVYATSISHNTTVRNLSILGIRQSAIELQGTASLVENCTIRIAGGTGILNLDGIVKNCIVLTCGQLGISAHTVIGCHVDGAVGTGINASIVANSSARSSGSSGILASSTVTGSYGESTSTIITHRGIFCVNGTVTASRGITAGGAGIDASTVCSSRGDSSGTNSSSSSGINGTIVTASRGWANASGGAHGISATTVIGSHGRAVTGAWNGISSTLATHSYGLRGSDEINRYGISSFQANGCRAINGQNITHKFNMP